MSLYEIDEKPNYTKISKYLKFEGKGCKQKELKNISFDKKIVFNGFKMFNLKCKSHVQEKILLENMFGCPLKLIFGIYGNLCIFGYKPKHSYTIMYECENSPPPHELS